MRTPSRYEKFLWSYLNIFGKFFGVAACFVSTIFIITVFMDIIKQTSFYPSDDRVAILILMPIMFVIGILFIRVKPYYPKEYEEYFQKAGKIQKDK